MINAILSLLAGLFASLIPIGIAAGAIGLVLFAIGQHRKIAAARAAAAAALGLRVERVGIVGTGHVTGTREGLSVDVRDIPMGKTRAERITITLPGFASDLALSGEGLLSAVGKVFVGEDVATGDPSFDSEIVVRGQRPRALAALDAAARQRVLDLVRRRGFTLKDGKLTRQTGRMTTDASTLTSLLRDAVTLGRTLHSLADADIPTRLSWNAANDPLETVRRRNLLVLCESFRDSPVTRAACHHAVEDPSPWMRLEAARTLGTEGMETLRGLITDPSCPERVAVDAFHSYAAAADRAATLREVDAAIERGTRMIRVAAVRMAGELRHEPVRERLADLALDRDAAVARAAVTALGIVGNAGSETALSGALGHADPEVRAGAARSLGAVGTIGAIPALRAVLDDSGANRALRASAKDAIRGIQSRVVGAEAGQLTLGAHEGRAGALSLADTTGAARGRVSLTSSSSSSSGSSSPPDTPSTSGTSPSRKAVTEG